MRSGPMKDPKLVHLLHPLIATLLICTMLAPTLMGCMARTWSDLPAHVHRAWVCTRTPDVEPDARYWAVHLATGTVVSDKDPDDFDEFAPHADIIYIYDSTARAESVHAFPIPYNQLSCENPDALLPRAVDNGPSLPDGRDNPLRNAQWDPLNTTLEDVSPSNLRFLGVTTSSTKKREPEIIRVCTHPPDVRADAAEWLFTTEKAGASYTRDSDLYARLRATAVRVYVFDPDAPGESVLRFPSPHNRLRCPGKPLPGDDPPPGADPEYKEAIDAMVKALGAKASVSEFGGTGGSDKRTWTSDPDGHDARLTFFEAVVRQMAITGAFQTGDVSGNLKDPNGSRYGIPNGKNLDGPDSLTLQFVAGTFMLLKNPLRSTGAFIRKIAGAARRKGILIITNPDLMPKAIAGRLALFIPSAPHPGSGHDGEAWHG